jgi:hypothetical protein
MVFFKQHHLQQDEISLGDMHQLYGHVVHVHAHYRPPLGNPELVVYKENKSASAELSFFEVSFSQLARLFFQHDLTPPQILVKSSHGEVVGLASEHLSHTIARRELLPNEFYRLEPQEGALLFVLSEIRDAKELPFYFLNQLPQSFFASLLSLHQAGKITLNFESLASVLTGSYTLEEDDLHKGNLGLYIVKKNDKPEVVLIKVDHDLMLADSVMSHCHSRFFNWLNGVGAFEVTARDLTQFPYLKDSQNYYWPTTKRYRLTFNSKAYTENSEVEAFQALANDPIFNQFKWQEFYRHILIEPEMMKQSLARHLEKDQPDQRAKMALITQSVVTRLSKLRAVLFTIPEFRAYVQSLDAKRMGSLVDNIVGEDTSYRAQILSKIRQQQTLCNNFVLGDTPLHAAIRLKDYRYHDTWQSFGHFANRKNIQGKKPVDIAQELDGELWPEDVRKSKVGSLLHLNAMMKSRDEDGLFEDYLYHDHYPEKAFEAESAMDLKLLLQDLGEDYRYSLKMQKELAIYSVKRFIAAHQKKPNLLEMLEALKVDLNGKGDTPPAPGLQFIRQLRSQLWIVRIVRGLLGGTSTQVQLNHLLDEAIQNASPKEYYCGLWFFSPKKTTKPDDTRNDKQVPNIN